MTLRRLLAACLATAILAILAQPAARIVLTDPDGSHDHRRPDASIPGTDIYTSSHRTPFWPRYWRLLLGRAWPGDYTFPGAPGESLVDDPTPPAGP